MDIQNFLRYKHMIIYFYDDAEIICMQTCYILNLLPCS